MTINLIGDWTISNSEAVCPIHLMHKQCRGFLAQGLPADYSVQAMTQQQLTRDPEARLLLASNVTMPSNGFVFHKCITVDS